jgi:hypothetical protein
MLYDCYKEINSYQIVIKLISPPPFLLRLDGGQGGRQHKQLRQRHWVYDKAFPKKKITASPEGLTAIRFG